MKAQVTHGGHAPTVLTLISVPGLEKPFYHLMRDSTNSGFVIQQLDETFFIPDVVVDAMARTLGYIKEGDDEE